MKGGRKEQRKLASQALFKKNTMENGVVGGTSLRGKQDDRVATS